MLELPFYARDAATVAKALLGQHLLVKSGKKTKRSRIVETEAYLGTHDLASHASKGRTKRTEIMFGEAGKAYVYLIYGMYELFNIVVSETGDPQAVLIRAVEPLDNIKDATNGPGKLSRALGITRRDNGKELFGPRLWLEPGTSPKRITVTRRIGVDYAGEWAKKPLRFYDAESMFVSRQ